MRAAAKELHFNKGGETLKRMQAGVDKLASVVGVTLGPKGRNVVLESKCAAATQNSTISAMSYRAVACLLASNLLPPPESLRRRLQAPPA